MPELNQQTRINAVFGQSCSRVRGGTMFWSDAIYILLLLGSVAFGPFYRKIQDPQVKQWTSTVLGFLLVALVSGGYFLHPLITTLVNAIIITKLSPKISHVVSVYFSFFYLLIIFRMGELFSLPTASTHANLVVMMLTIKLAGLAFELNVASTAPADDPTGMNSDSMKKVGFLDVFHYAFSYMAVLTGPYYRYRTYWDSVHRPFSKYSDPWPATFFKLKQIVVFSALYLILNQTFDPKYIMTDEYADTSLLYKLFLMYPTFCIFRLRMFIGMGLSECVCQMAGVGVYPTVSNTIPGLGPRDYKMIVELSSTSHEKLKEENYDYETVHNMNVFEVETCITVRTAMKVWNTCMQYWMANCIYKRFPYKSLRTAVTFLMSALWHGYAAGYYFCICQVPLYMLLEDVLMKFHKNTPENSMAKKGFTLFMWFLRVTCMAYLGVPFMLLDFHEIIHFYKSLYCSGHILMLVLYIIVRAMKPYILKREERREKEK